MLINNEALKVVILVISQEVLWETSWETSYFKGFAADITLTLSWDWMPASSLINSWGSSDEIVDSLSSIDWIDDVS